MPSATLLALAEEALDNPAFDSHPPETFEKRKMGRPQVLSDGNKPVTFRLEVEQLTKIDRLRGKKSRSEFIRDLVDGL